MTTPGVELALQVVAEALERVVELSGEFCRAEDADVVRRECLRVLAGCAGEGAAVAQLLHHLGDGALQSHVGGLVADGLERLGE
jgi:hypothetical protein